MGNVDIDNSEDAGNGESQKQSNPKIVPDVATDFTYAFYQSAIPVIRSIRIANMGSQHFEGCRLDLASTPSFLRRKSWSIDRLRPDDELNLSDREVEHGGRSEASEWIAINERLRLRRARLDEAIARARRHSTTSEPTA